MNIVKTLNIMKTISERLLEAYRESRFSSYAELSRAAGLKSASTVSDLMRGRTHSESPSLPMLAYALGVNPIWLQHGKGNKKLLDNAAFLKDDTQLEDALLLLTLFKQSTSNGRRLILAMAKEAEKELFELQSITSNQG